MSDSAASFQLSRLTIRVKLLVIVGGLIAVALIVMIFLATNSFSQSMTNRVQENNLNLAEVIGGRTRNTLESLMGSVRQVGSDEAARTFFQNNPDVIYTGDLADTRGLRGGYFNTEYLNARDLKRADFQALLEEHGEVLGAALEGPIVVHNASPGFARAILAVAFPADRAGRMYLVLADAAEFLAAFSAAENEHRIATIFLVDGTGTIVAHSDVDYVLSGTDVSTMPIVQALLESKTDWGQAIYRYEDREWVGSYFRPGIGALGVIATSPSDVVFADVFRIQRNNLLILFIVLNAALLIGFFFARTLTRPIKKLVAGTEEVARGKYDITLKPTSRDEIGQLTASFLDMTQGLGERERIKQAFGQFVNPEIAERAMRGEIGLGGEERHCAIFFSDLRGFTAMSEKMQPKQVVEFLNAYFREMVNCVKITEGEVDKFIGDAVMAHWGAFNDLPNTSENAINAALLMRAALIEFNERMTAQGWPVARMGCGINVGEVVAGQIGSAERLEFTVIGDAVNLASRIEALNKPFATDILISADTYAEVKDIYRVAKMPAIEVKGKSEPQAVYAVLERNETPEPADLRALRDMVGIPHPEGEVQAPTGGEEKFKIVE